MSSGHFPCWVGMAVTARQKANDTSNGNGKRVMLAVFGSLRRLVLFVCFSCCLILFHQSSNVFKLLPRLRLCRKGSNFLEKGPLSRRQLAPPSSNPPPVL
jgi:hypothetical protein